jgi:hypothetical protein
MKTVLLVLLSVLVALTPAFAQQINPNQIRPGLPGQVMTTVGNQVNWATGPVYSVLAFGAACDGSTDDSAAIQAAVNAAEATTASSPGTVLIPPGNSCLFGSTITITGFTLVTGVGPKPAQGTPFFIPNHGGSGLIYTGTGDAFLVQNGSPTNFTFYVSFRNLNFTATHAANSFIHFYGINGPSYVENNNFFGNELATSAVIYEQPGAGLQVVTRGNYFSGFAGNELVVHDMNNYVAEGNQFFDSFGAGIYISGCQGAELHNNYFEMMHIGIEVGNDDENHFQMSIHDNSFRNYQVPPIHSPTSVATQRCFVVKSTTDGLPFYGQGTISHNDCNLSLGAPPETTGPEPYGIDFETASNTFYVNQNWLMSDNSIAGTTTSGIFSDRTAVSVTYSNIQAISAWTPGSNPPSNIPAVSGSGTFQSLLTDRPTVGPRLGTEFYTWQHEFDSFTNTTSTGTLEIVLPVHWSSSKLMFRVSGYNFPANTAWEVLVGGFNGGTAWTGGTASVLGTPPFTSVRLADNGTNNLTCLARPHQTGKTQA